jgi:hypothetical protein
MFPTGGAGVALLVLRCVVAATVFDSAIVCAPVGAESILDGAAVLVGLCLGLGVVTPYCAAISCLLEVGLLITTGCPSRFQLTTSALTAGATAGLGPGAYSVDARLFGRRVFKIPRRGSST